METSSPDPAGKPGASVKKIIAAVLIISGCIAAAAVFFIMYSLSLFSPVHSRTDYEGSFTASDGTVISVKEYTDDPDFLAKTFCELKDPHGGTVTFRINGWGEGTVPLDYRSYKTDDESFIWVCRHDGKEYIYYQKDGETQQGFTYDKDYRTEDQKQHSADAALRVSGSGFIDTLPDRCDKARFKEYFETYNKYTKTNRGN